MDEIKALLKKLIGIKSMSGIEDEIISFISGYLDAENVHFSRIGNNIIVTLGEGKKTLAVVAHVDTVPVVGGWKSDPFAAEEKDGRIYGLGACDNKASVASLLTLIRELRDAKLEKRVTFIFSSEEETMMKGIEKVLPFIGKPDAALIAEPTGLAPCTCQKGLLRLTMKANGRSCHASSPASGENAIIAACDDIMKINAISFSKKDPLLGYPTIAVTMISGGTKPNIIPGSCTAELDIRTTPGCDNEKMIGIIKSAVKSEIEIVSKRLMPKQTESSHPFAKLAENACGKPCAGFPAGSEMYFFDCPAVVLGPGSLSQAHQPDEYIDIEEFVASKKIFEKIIRGF